MNANIFLLIIAQLKQNFVLQQDTALHRPSQPKCPKQKLHACAFPAAPQQQPVDPRKPRAGPGAIPSQPLPRPGAVASQPSTSGPPGQGVQPWRPSPSFREQQQQQQQQPTVLHPHISSHLLPVGNAGSTDPRQHALPPQDPRRARQQQQAQLLPPPLAGLQQGLNGVHVSGAGQAADGPAPSYGQHGTGSSGSLVTCIVVVAHAHGRDMLHGRCAPFVVVDKAVLGMPINQLLCRGPPRREFCSLAIQTKQNRRLASAT